MAQVEESEKKRTRRSAEKKPDKRGREANAVVRYFRETRGELRKVTWPTQEESLRLTAIVIAVTILMSLFLFSFDFLFSSALEWIVTTLAL